MADNEPIEIRVSAEGVEAAAAKINSLAQDAKNMGDATHKAGAVGKLGLWGLGEAAENAAQSMGIPNQAARRLGNTVEDLVGKTGKYAAMFGVVGLAVAGAVTAWKYYEDQQRKAREEIIKTGHASGQWVEAALGEAAETRELAQAKKQLQQAEFDLNKARMEQALPAAKAALEELNKQYASAVKFQDARSEISATVVKQHIKDIKLEVGKAAAQLKLLEAQTVLFTAENRSGLTGGKPKEEKSEVTVTNQYEREAAYQAQLVELYRATGVSKEEVWQQELMAFDTATAAKMANAGSEQQYYDTLALRDMERQTKVANHDVAEAARAAALKKQLEQQAWSFASNLGSALVDIHNKHEKQSIDQQKRAAKNKIWINAAVGVTKELATEGWAGLATGALILAEAAVQAAVVDSQNYGSGSGSSPSLGGGMPSTAPPAGGGGTINIYVNGQKAGSYKTGAGAVLKEIYEGNGSVDGYSVSVERHA